MILRSNSFRRAFVFSLLSIGIFSACIFSPPGDQNPSPGPPTGFDRKTRPNTLEFYEKVWKHKLYTEYEEVLHQGYEFFPRSEDADDFGWMEGDSWGKTTELDMAAHMFDPNFVGGQQPVDLIEMELDVLNEVLVDEASQRYEITCDQKGSVMWSATDGNSFDTRIVLEVIPDPLDSTLWQIVRQTEMSRT